MFIRVALGSGLHTHSGSVYKKLTGALAAGLLVLCAYGLPSGQAAAAPIVSTSPYNLNESLIGARFRAFRTLPGENELFVGVPSLGNGPPRRTQIHAVWASTNTISLTYDNIAQTLNGSISNVNGTFATTFNLAAHPPSSFGKSDTLDMLNAMNITLLERDGTSTATLRNITINGTVLPNIVGGLGGDNQSTLSITNVPFQTGFEWSATLELSGTFSDNAERSRLGIALGFDPSLNIVPEPELAALALIGFGGVMLARRQKRRSARQQTV